MGITVYPEIPFLQNDLITSWQNFYPTRKADFVAGRALANVQNAYQDAWDGPTAVYVWPTGPMQMQVVSTSANDAAAGTGIRTVHIHYLDNLYVPQVTVVTLNGLTPVLTTPTNILRVNGMHAMSIGTVNGVAAGDISIQAVGGAVTYGVLKTGLNRMRQAFYTVPAGHGGYVKKWQVASGSASGTHFTQVELQATCHEGLLLPGVFLYQDGTGGENFAVEIAYDIPLYFPPQTDVKVRAISDAANANATVITNISGWFE